ncbi:hypothetical protein NDU88_004062 [Pleurodeles waltl]|uniref:Uncharacterized protein n=1 Tax=Pleurodeles waltl TaxID=8319 RepID=A0AAV7VHN7_PLEWA|nr:hypothetical protein NDU88_004062 [Pleurodeles waltl]
MGAAPSLARLQDQLQTAGERSCRGTEGGGLLERQMAATETWRAAMVRPHKMADLPTSDKDKTSHTEAGETEESLDHESVVGLPGNLPHVTPQTAEDII